MAMHCLKLWSEFFTPIVEGRKPFEIRKDDRGFNEGDLLILTCVDRETGEPDGWKITARVTYKTPGGQFGIAADHCVLGIRVLGASRAPAPGLPFLGVRA